MDDSELIFEGASQLSMDDSDWDAETGTSAFGHLGRKRSASEALDAAPLAADGDDDDDDDDGGGQIGDATWANTSPSTMTLDEASVETQEASAANVAWASMDEATRLLHELASVRQVTTAMAHITDNLRAAQAGILRFTETTTRTDELLDMWVRLFSQAEHTQRLLHDEQWTGASADVLRTQREAEEQERARQEQLAREEGRGPALRRMTFIVTDEAHVAWHVQPAADPGVVEGAAEVVVVPRPPLQPQVEAEVVVQHLVSGSRYTSGK
ncbi:DASH complex subunit Duo1-domain-containing protein [Thamnocephalis sphaerospora]|uniref:DASH complex subunit DUO1 n=1 Tax=Thamnocephalis sphaerospora TaxID=78915 RepID=A0A4P9XUE5_9FUNG|nr:DASH complex subunit Duo1-domain-containing protein [Thamnocephalis sphaerospora]|eukprot:RKP09833.1 DASH complex subunit Duo1-domain-containing protein [Thamnocephalis sphaerospora]